MVNDVSTLQYCCSWIILHFQGGTFYPCITYMNSLHANPRWMTKVLPASLLSANLSLWQSSTLVSLRGVRWIAQSPIFLIFRLLKTSQWSIPIYPEWYVVSGDTLGGSSLVGGIASWRLLVWRLGVARGDWSWALFQVSSWFLPSHILSLLVKASVGYLRVLGKWRLFLPPLRTAPAGFDYLPEHQKNVVYVSVSDWPITHTHTL